MSPASAAGWMAVATFVVFHELSKASPTCWFMMQIAMFFGYAPSCPVNSLLIIEERM